MAPSKPVLLSSLICAVVGVGLGVLLGFVSWGRAGEERSARETRSGDEGHKLEGLTREADSSVSARLLAEIKADNIASNLRFLSSQPNIAGSRRERELAHHIRDLWEKQGLDSSKIYSYDVLLSFPDSNNPNKVQIIDENGTAVFTSSAREEVFDQTKLQDERVPPFNAYAPAGVVQGELVYAHYARAYDFDLLEDLGVDVRGRVVIARYGWLFRGNKLKEAESRGAIGLILYSDPHDYNSEGATETFPSSWWLPGSGVQRGNVVLLKGDQLTQGYPAKGNMSPNFVSGNFGDGLAGCVKTYQVMIKELITDYAYRMTDEALKQQLPKIPCQPISYDDAKQLLSGLGGAPAPRTWQGGLDIGTYRLGPGFNVSHNNSQVRLEVNNKNVVKTIDNVIGKITGSIEPDRYVLVGSHRDAWVYGAVDPASSQAALLELARAFTKLSKQGWRPRRTIVFCSWGGEESGLIGSTEWVEELAKVLIGRAVSYHNMDTAVIGNYTLNGRATPSLRYVLMNATQQVADPANPELTVYDTWSEREPDGDEPWIAIPGSGSDFAPFLQAIGVPVTDHAYIYDWGLGISSYPLYHTGYDTNKLMELIDPDFRYCRAVGQVAAEMVRHLADAYVLPLDAKEYARVLQVYVSRTWRRFGSKLEKNKISFGYLRSAARSFSEAASQFHQRLDKVDRQNPLEVRRLNDQLLLLERAFTDPAGLPNRPLYRHLVFSPSSKDHYSGAAFSGLADLLYDIDKQPDQDQAWERVKRHLAAITYVIQSAALTLHSDT